MRRLWRNRKAFALIVIALIFLLSIAVSAWMGALTFTFMKTEELRIVAVDFNVGTPRTIDIHVRNTGTATATITDAKVGDTLIGITNEDLPPGAGTEIRGISFDWVSGTAYNVAVVTSAGNIYTYRAAAPPT